MKKKLLLTVMALVCALTCAFSLTACGDKKELNCLKVFDASVEKYKNSLDLGYYYENESERLTTDLNKLKFIFEYYPDNSTEAADMTKVKNVYFYSDGNGSSTETDSIPQTLQLGYYTLYYYVEGHKPTSDFSDALCVSISFRVDDAIKDRTFTFQDMVLQDASGNVLTDESNVVYGEYVTMTNAMKTNNENSTVVCREGCTVRGTMDFGGGAFDGLGPDKVFRWTKSGCNVTILSPDATIDENGNVSGGETVGSGVLDGNTFTLTLPIENTSYKWVVTFAA